jgi:hypothetical protein
MPAFSRKLAPAASGEKNIYFGSKKIREKLTR